ncbi:MAG: hypothetical protein DWQ11_16365 [Proteobacteria bacterium]|nr:MAG: hypothetical protein DWQ11_16365 [Pseudomonadota bacterium]
MRKRTAPSKRPGAVAIRLAGLAALLLWSLAVPAQSALPLTIITLQHRTVDEVLPALRPHLAPEGQLSGINDKLLIRTDADNLRMLRDALAAIDTPPMRLRVSVRSDRTDSGHRFDVGVGGEVRSGDVAARLPGRVPGDTRIELGGIRAGLGETTRSVRRGGAQFVETRDGGEATLFVGTAVPLAFRQVFIQPDGARVVRGTTYRGVGQGVSVRPTVIGQRVRLLLSPEASDEADGGRVSVMRLETEVEGRLGEWIAVGGANRAETVSESRGVAIGSVSSADSDTRAAFWVRVDPVGD